MKTTSVSIFLSLLLFSCATPGEKLVKAAAEGDGEKVKALVNSNAPLSYQNEQGETALMLATSSSRLNVVEALLSHDLSEQKAEDALAIAKEQGDAAIVNSLESSLLQGQWGLTEYSSSTFTGVTPKSEESLYLSEDSFFVYVNDKIMMISGNFILNTEEKTITLDELSFSYSFDESDLLHLTSEEEKFIYTRKSYDGNPLAR
jgi:hypothetical protein